jgi:hypothetical protein
MTTYQPPPYPQQPQAQYYPPVRRRPLGVTIMAILMILYGILMVVVSLALFGLAALSSMQEIIDQLGTDIPQWLIDAAPIYFGIAGVVVLIFAIIAFLLAWGFLKGKRWAWIVGVIFVVLNIISTVISAIVTGSLAGIATLGLSILIPVIVLVYLLLPSTKAWFTL